MLPFIAVNNKQEQVKIRKSKPNNNNNNNNNTNNNNKSIKLYQEEMTNVLGNNGVGKSSIAL
jgi:ABC-type cobalamin/Fe3+-siderophores transport system ATPase subunit